MDATGSISRLDRHGFQWVVGRRVSILDPVFVVLSYAATGGTLWVVLAILLGRRSGRQLLPLALLSAGIVWGADAVATVVKLIVNRPPPFVSIQHVSLLIGRPSSGSLPSAHATTAFAGAVLLSWLCPHWSIAFVLLAVAVAFSRVYVGVHSPADVLSGAALGAAVAMLGIHVVNRTRFRARVTPAGASREAT